MTFGELFDNNDELFNVFKPAFEQLNHLKEIEKKFKISTAKLK